MTETNTQERPPIVAVVGHIDHGKSTLLDTIRTANTTGKEAGGITQHVAAYEVEHTTSEGKSKKITFIDTPGHAAFIHGRTHGTTIADIAILVVSAEDGPKEQTIEALKIIKDTETPFVVAVNKIDSEKANLEKTLSGLAEAEVYVEGRGGDVPYVALSAKSGQGIDELLETLLLVAELEELTGDTTLPAHGFVIEAHRDERTGNTATLIITNGSLATGSYISAGSSCSPVRSIVDTLGNRHTEMHFSAPVVITGWNTIPPVGSTFTTHTSKKEAEKVCKDVVEMSSQDALPNETEASVSIPVVIKADVVGTAEALKHELTQLPQENVALTIVHTGVGTITEGDIKNMGFKEGAVVFGFNVKVESGARDLAERLGVTIETSDIIYKLTEWMEEEILRRTPKEALREKHGDIKILKPFGRTKKSHIVGGRVEEGLLKLGDAVIIKRRDAEIGTGKVIELQMQKNAASEVPAGEEFGAKIETQLELAKGDTLEAYDEL